MSAIVLVAGQASQSGQSDGGQDRIAKIVPWNLPLAEGQFKEAL